jgi:hypothetical protein
MAAKLTPLQLIAGFGLLQNFGLRLPPAFTTAVVNYNALPFASKLLTAVSWPNLDATNQVNIKKIGAATIPALGDTVPTVYVTSIVLTNTLYTGYLIATANKYLGNGDYAKFAQGWFASLGYAASANQFSQSACNSDYLGKTFTGMNNTVTGDITQVNLATPSFGSDLSKLGYLIDMEDLDNLGSPLSLIQRIVKLTGSVPSVALTFVDYGVPEEVVVNLTNLTLSVTDAVQKAMYEAMTRVTGDALAQILQVLNITTPNITSMADLLNPYKLFPTSFQTLTVPTMNGPRAIYINSTGSVNTKLGDTSVTLTALPDYILSSKV